MTWTRENLETLIAGTRASIEQGEKNIEKWLEELSELENEYETDE